MSLVFSLSNATCIITEFTIYNKKCRCVMYIMYENVLIWDDYDTRENGKTFSLCHASLTFAKKAYPFPYCSGQQGRKESCHY